MCCGSLDLHTFFCPALIYILLISLPCIYLAWFRSYLFIIPFTIFMFLACFHFYLLLSLTISPLFPWLSFRPLFPPGLVYVFDDCTGVLCKLAGTAWCWCDTRGIGAKAPLFLFSFLWLFVSLVWLLDPFFGQHGLVSAAVPGPVGGISFSTLHSLYQRSCLVRNWALTWNLNVDVSYVM